MGLGQTYQQTRGWLGITLKRAAILGSIAAGTAMGVEYGMSAATTCLVYQDTETPIEQKTDKCMTGPIDWLLTLGRN